MGAKVFLSYSHADEALRNQFEKHLAMLKRSGEIDVWHDRQLKIGDHLDDTITQYLDSSDIIVFLVSSDFLDSYYCYEREMSRAMERVANGDAKIAPIVLRACEWERAPFANYVMAPTDAKPITAHPDIDAAFLDVVRQLRRLLAEMDRPADSQPAASPPIEVEPASFITRVEEPRTSNLRVRTNFTDADRARFLDEGFDFIVKFMANSAIELSARHSDIDARTKRIDAEKLTIELFRNGKSTAAATISVDRTYGKQGMIAYSNEISAYGSGMNGGLMIENDDQLLYFKPWMFSLRRSQDEDTKLTYQGAAELLWSEVIEPLQR